jgi:hypothetical protein
MRTAGKGGQSWVDGRGRLFTGGWAVLHVSLDRRRGYGTPRSQPRSSERKRDRARMVHDRRACWRRRRLRSPATTRAGRGARGRRSTAPAHRHRRVGPPRQAPAVDRRTIDWLRWASAEGDRCDHLAMAHGLPRPVHGGKSWVPVGCGPREPRHSPPSDTHVMSRDIGKDRTPGVRSIGHFHLHRSPSWLAGGGGCG